MTMLPSRTIRFGLICAILVFLLIEDGLASIKSTTSLADEYFETFAKDLVESPRVFQERSYTRTAQLISYIQTPSRNSPGFNISMDISGCGRSMKRSTLAGIYEYANGTVQDDATVGDILADLKALKQSAPDLQTAESRISSHTLTVAKTAERIGIDFLYGGLICRSSSETSESIYNELRRLLWLSPEMRRRVFRKFCILLASSVAAGAAVGIGIFSVTLLPQDWGIDHTHDDQTRSMAGDVAMITGVGFFLFNVVLLILQSIGNGVIRAAEAFPAHVLLAIAQRWWRRMQDDAIPLLEEPRRQSAGSSSFSLGPARTSSVQTGSSSATSTPSPGRSACVQEDVAAELALNVGNNPQEASSVHAFEIEPYGNLEADMEMEIVIDGHCHVQIPQ